MSEVTTQSVWLKGDPTDGSLSGTSGALFGDSIHARITSYGDDEPSDCARPCEIELNSVDPDFAIEVPVEALASSAVYQGQVRVDTNPAVRSRYWYLDDVAYIDFDSHDDAVRAFDDSQCADINLGGDWKSSGQYHTLPVLGEDENSSAVWKSDWFFLGSSDFKTKDKSGPEFTGTVWIARQLCAVMDPTTGA